jgi:hypothetical protein
MLMFTAARSVFASSVTNAANGVFGLGIKNALIAAFASQKRKFQNSRPVFVSKDEETGPDTSTFTIRFIYLKIIITKTLSGKAYGLVTKGRRTLVEYGYRYYRYRLVCYNHNQAALAKVVGKARCCTLS